MNLDPTSVEAFNTGTLKGVRFYCRAHSRNVMVLDEGIPFAGMLIGIKRDGKWETIRTATQEDRAVIEAARLNRD